MPNGQYIYIQDNFFYFQIIGNNKPVMNAIIWLFDFTFWFIGLSMTRASGLRFVNF